MSSQSTRATVTVANASDIARRDFAAALGQFISAYARACSYHVQATFPADSLSGRPVGLVSWFN